MNFNSSFNAALQIPHSSPSVRVKTTMLVVSLVTQVPGKRELTMILHVPSICFAQRRSLREVLLSCPFEHTIRD